MNPLQPLANIFKGGAQARTLHEAVENDDSGRIGALVQQGAQVNEADPNGWTPLHLAAWLDSAKALGELLNQGAGLEHRDQKGRTAAHLAAFSGSERSLRKLLHAGASTEAKDEVGLTPLHKASVRGQLATLRVLLSYNADTATATPDGLLAMHLAAWKGQTEAVRELSTRARGQGALDVQSADGSTALHEGVRSGVSAVVQLLLQLGANAGIKDKHGRTPADLAFAAGNRQLFTMLSDAERGLRSSAPSPSAPTDLWSHLEKEQAPAAAEVQPAPAPADTSVSTARESQHPREQFEAWVQQLLFPQTRKQGSSVPASSTASRDAPVAPAHTTGAVGGSLFAQKRGTQPPDPAPSAPPATAAPQPPSSDASGVRGTLFDQRRAEAQQTSTDPKPGSTGPATKADGSSQGTPVQHQLQMDLSPYDDGAPDASPYVAMAAPSVQRTGVSDSGQEEDVLGNVLKAVGRRAQQDLARTLNAGATLVGNLMEQHAARQQRVQEQQKGEPEPAVEGQADAGDDTYDDDDEYDPAKMRAVEGKMAKVGSDWGKQEEPDDGWAPKRPQKSGVVKSKQSDGKPVLSKKEAEAVLDRLDAVTAQAHGWLRGESAGQHLATMKALAAQRGKDAGPVDAKEAVPAAPKLYPEPSAPPQQQEAAQLGVQRHLQMMKHAAGLAAQHTVNPMIPVVPMPQLWEVSNGFSSSGLLYEDRFGKVYQADVLGGVHAIRVLNPGVFSQTSLAQWLQTAACMQHPHQVKLKGSLPEHGVLVTELPPCGNLLYTLQNGSLPLVGRMHWLHCVDVALAVASVVLYLHNQDTPVPHGTLSATTVQMDAQGVALVADVGMALMGSKDSKGMRVTDLHAVGELLLQLLTMNVQPIDASTRARIVQYVRSGAHIPASPWLGWPQPVAQQIESMAATCLEAADLGGEQTQTLLRQQVVAPLLQIRGAAVEEFFKEPVQQEAMTSGYYSGLPGAFRCALTHQVMLDPVLAADGFVYERCALQEWLSIAGNRSPLTNDVLPRTAMVDQLALQRSIQTWLKNR